MPILSHPQALFVQDYSGQALISEEYLVHPQGLNNQQGLIDWHLIGRKLSPRRLKTLIYRVLLLSILLITASGCTENQVEPASLKQTTNYQYQIPAYRNDGWQVGHLADNGINEVAITQLLEYLTKDKTHGIDSISLVRNNTLLLHQDIRESFSEYDGWIDNRDLKKHLVHSTSKSFVSALTGIAIQQGFIESANSPFYSLFDYSNYQHWQDDKSTMTLEDVLTMRLGLTWDEWSKPYGDPDNSLTSLVENNRDFVKALLDLPLASKPGQQFAYNTAASIALGKAVETRSGMALADFAEQYLFEPLQIEGAQWLMTPDQSANTGSGLFLRTRDMAKFGQLYLDHGIWNGIQVIDPVWVRSSLKNRVKLDWDFTSGYGFQWWLGQFTTPTGNISFYSTRGFGGQFIIIVPRYQLVAAFTGHNYDNEDYDYPFEILEQIILPSIES